MSLKDSLPLVRRQIFECTCQRGSTHEDCARELRLSEEQFVAEHGAMLRSLRLGATHH